MRRKIAAGNWKMNGILSSISELKSIATHGAKAAEVIICPPFTLLGEALAISGQGGVKIGAQNAHNEDNGAYTGEISAQMIKDMGATHVILGHSERRELFNESDEFIRSKAEAVHKAGLIAILCVGETLSEREAGKASEVVGKQLRGSLPAGANGENTIIAYEPVWAIGTGKVPSNDDIAEIHGFIRSIIPNDAENMRVLYGGSVKASNAEEIFAIDNVDGGLVGGASLKASDFLPIIEAADQLSK